MLPMINQFPWGIKKVLWEMLKEKYHPNEHMIERLSQIVLTESDYKAMGKLIADIYENAYMKSVNEHKKILEKHGLSVKIVPQTQAVMPRKIFQEEKSG
jgi:hypothetical protein